MNDWRRVTNRERCPVCDHPDWCLIGEKAVICMRMANNRPKTFKDGSVGYIYTDETPRPPRPVRRDPEPPSDINPTELMYSYRRNTKPEQYGALSAKLGVSVSSIESFGFAWASGHSAWAIPMHNGSGSVVGIRLRAMDGQKWAVKGSKQGVFLPKGHEGWLNEPGEFKRTVIITEGPTDACAGLDLGFFTIGRPSCNGAVVETVGNIVQLRISRAVIISDNDEVGLRGATILGRELPIPTCTLVLPTKDLREFKQFGGNTEMLGNLVNSQVWRMPMNYDNRTTQGEVPARV